MRTNRVIWLLVISGIALLIAINSGMVEYEEGKLSIDLQNTSDNVHNLYQDVENRSSESFENFSEKISRQTIDYQLQVTEVRRLNACVEKAYGEREPCLYVNLELKSNHKESAGFKITRKVIITKDGRQLDRYGGLFEIKELDKLCDSSTSFRVYPGARKDIGMCFPTVSKNDRPVLYVGISTGEEKEYSMDLTPYIS